MTRPHFHVLNGEATLAILRRTAVPGEFLVWPDMLMEGPLSGGRGGRPDPAQRAAFLAAEYGAPRRETAARLKGFAKALDIAARSNGEVTLWFEEDAFCQINLACLLATLPPALRKRGRLSLVCPAEPLGRRSPRALQTLFRRRTPVTAALRGLARKAWSALSAPPPRAGRKLEALVASAGAFAAWPLLKRGLKAQLDRLPAEAGPRKGLGSLESAILKALGAAGRPLGFVTLFREVTRHPRIRPLGLGDAQVARCLLGMAARREAPGPLLAIRGLPGKRRAAGLAPAMKFGGWRVSRT